jgi:hypothetical protein
MFGATPAGTRLRPSFSRTRQAMFWSAHGVSPDRPRCETDREGERSCLGRSGIRVTSVPRIG